MKCKGAEVEFESIPSAYWIEKSGLKNHTEKVITEEEAKWVNNHKVATIRITHSEDPTQDFTREVTNICREGEIGWHYLYSFTWKHEEEVQK